MSKFKKLTIYFLLSIFTISLIPNKVFASDFENKIINEEVEYFNDGTLILGESEFKVLHAIENIPDETIASGSDSINRYFYEKGITQIKVNDKVRQKRGVVGCVSAVGVALVVNFTPAKIVKAKSALKAVGGAAKFIQKAVGF